MRAGGWQSSYGEAGGPGHWGHRLPQKKPVDFLWWSGFGEGKGRAARGLRLWLAGAGSPGSKHSLVLGKKEI